MKNEEQTKSVNAAEKTTGHSSFLSQVLGQASVLFTLASKCVSSFPACVSFEISNQSLVCDLVSSFSSHLLFKLEGKRLTWLHTD